MRLTPEQFQERLTGFTRSAWRWEAQQLYNFPAELEQVARYLAGEPKPDGYNATWLNRVKSIADSGRTVGRVRAVRRPLTDYVRCQLEWVTPDSIEAGEDIRILDVTGDDLGLPAHDWWLLDDARVIVLNFSDDGSLIDIEELDDPEVGQYRIWMATALSHAMTFDEHARTERH